MDVDAERINNVLARACAAIDGDLILVGGALVAIWLDPRRRTEDIDIFHVRDRAGAQVALWDIAAEVGLPIEAVNGAAEYFIRRIPGWEEGLTVVCQGARGRVLRPSATVFMLSKIGRLSERDLEDCRSVLARDDLALERDRIIRALEQLGGPDADHRLAKRRAILGSWLVRR